jgi:hypothetical protein
MFKNIIEVVKLYSNNCIKNLNHKACGNWDKYFPLETDGEIWLKQLLIRC